MVLVTVKPQAVRNASAAFGEICGQISEKLAPEEIAAPELKNKEDQLAAFLEESPYSNSNDRNRRQAAGNTKTDNSIKTAEVKIANEPATVRQHIVPANYEEKITAQKQPSQVRWASATEEIRPEMRSEPVSQNTGNAPLLSPFSSMSVQQVGMPPAIVQSVPAQPVDIQPAAIQPTAIQPAAAEPQPAYSSVYQQPLAPQQRADISSPYSPQTTDAAQINTSQINAVQTTLLPDMLSSKTPQPFAIQPAVIAETVPCHGTETVARVGTQVILMCDILPQLRRVGLRQFKEQLSKISEEERNKVPENEKEQFLEMFAAQCYPQFLQEQINVILVYNDFIMSKSREEVEFYLKNIGQQFDEEDVPAMMKEFGVNDLAALKTYLNKELGSSLERERLLTSQSRIAQQWLMNSVRTAEGECTHGEMMEYYTAHQAEFESKARVKYRELTVNFTNHKTKLDAWNKIVWMGNETARGVPFDEMAKVNSEGFTASKGGLWDWISRGSITSKELEQVLFTQTIGMVNPPVIETSTGLHIIQVIEREDNRITPFIEAQVRIREKIRQQRRQKYQGEYIEELTRRFPSIVMRETIDFKTAQRTDSGSQK
ncbi:hypothetical protein FACS189427_09830 [Planctomycetales bacterium]|nr:hypothetical protein FACS189427_09830 [Planctomycetales bacterium]